jgi:hypothetical protein
VPLFAIPVCVDFSHSCRSLCHYLGVVRDAYIKAAPALKQRDIIEHLEALVAGDPALEASSRQEDLLVAAKRARDHAHAPRLIF